MNGKKFLGYVLVIALVLTSTAAFASDITDTVYTNVPGTTTQDSVMLIELEGQKDDSIKTLPPDQDTVDALAAIFNYVKDNNASPVSYFDKSTQNAIQALLPSGVDPNSLHMTEFMAVTLDNQSPAGSDGKTSLLLDVDYEVGQLAVMMIGREDENGVITWTPLKDEVVQVGLHEFTIPADLLQSANGHKVLLSVLTDRVGKRGGVVDINVIREHIVFPSKTAKDIIRIEKIYREFGEPMPDDFAILITDQTEQMTTEIANIRAFVKDEHHPLFNYFSQSVQDEAKLLMPQGTDTDTLLAYEVVAVSAVNYRDTYGDATAVIQFPTPYQDGQTVIALLGLYRADAQGFNGSIMDWTVLKASVQDNAVNVTFKQLLLPKMEIDKALLVILSEPIANK